MPSSVVDTDGGGGGGGLYRNPDAMNQTGLKPGGTKKAKKKTARSARMARSRDKATDESLMADLNISPQEQTSALAEAEMALEPELQLETELETQAVIEMSMEMSEKTQAQPEESLSHALADVDHMSHEDELIDIMMDLHRERETSESLGHMNQAHLASIAQLESSLQETVMAKAEVERQLDAAVVRRDELEREGCRLRDAGVAASDQLSSLQGQLDTEKANSAALVSATEKLGIDADGVRAELEEVKTNLAASREEINQRDGQIRDLHDRITSKEAEGVEEQAALRQQLEEAQLQLVQRNLSPWGQVVVICVDISGSLSGHLDEVYSTYLAILALLKARSPTSLVGVITHGGTARVTAGLTRVETDWGKLEEAVQVSQYSGTECHREALAEADRLLQPLRDVCDEKRVILLGDGHCLGLDHGDIDAVVEPFREHKTRIHSLIIDTGHACSGVSTGGLSHATDGEIGTLTRDGDKTVEIERVLFGSSWD